MSLVARPLRLSTTDSGFDAALAARLHWSADTDAGIEQAVADILADVRQRGDAAVLENNRRHEGGVHGEPVAPRRAPGRLRRPAGMAAPGAGEAAAARVRSYHEAQKRGAGKAGATATTTARCWGRRSRRWTAGIYVPGGKRPILVQLMNAIPAQVAGVAEIVMVVPTPRGEKNPLVLAAAHVAGVTRVFTIGGARRRPSRWPMERNRPAGRQDHRPAMPRWRRPSGACSARWASTHDRRPERDPALADGTTPADWVAMMTCSRRPNMTNWRRASCCVRTPATSTNRRSRRSDCLLPRMPRAEIIARSLNGRGALIQKKKNEKSSRAFFS